MQTKTLAKIVFSALALLVIGALINSILVKIEIKGYSAEVMPLYNEYIQIYDSVNALFGYNYKVIDDINTDYFTVRDRHREFMKKSDRKKYTQQQVYVLENQHVPRLKIIQSKLEAISPRSNILREAHNSLLESVRGEIRLCERLAKQYYRQEKTGNYTSANRIIVTDTSALANQVNISQFQEKMQDWQ